MHDSEKSTRRLLARTVVVLAFAATLFPPTRVWAGSDECVAPTPQQAVDAINGYLTPFVTNDAQDALAVPLAPDVRRSNLPPIYPQRVGGPITVRRAEELRAEYVAFPSFYFVTDYGGLRVFTDGCAAAGYFWLNFETLSSGRPPEAPPQTGRFIQITSHIVLRAWISRGLIEELELLQARSDGEEFGNCWPANGDPGQGRTTGCEREEISDPLAAVPGCVPSGRAVMRATARSYLDALASQDPSGVPLAAAARRTEMPPRPNEGPVTGTSDEEIRQSIAAGAAGTIDAVRNVRWTVQENQCHVTAHWLGDVRDAGTRHHVTRFMVSNGVIHEIEDIWTAPITPGAIEGSCWPKQWSDVEDETYRLVACPPHD